MSDDKPVRPSMQPHGGGPGLETATTTAPCPDHGIFVRDGCAFCEKTKAHFAPLFAPSPAPSVGSPSLREIAEGLAGGHYHCDDSWYCCSQCTVDRDQGGFDCADDARYGKPCDCRLEVRVTAIEAALDKARGDCMEGHIVARDEDMAQARVEGKREGIEAALACVPFDAPTIRALLAEPGNGYAVEGMEPGRIREDER